MSANKISLDIETTELVIFKSPRKILPNETKIKLSAKRLYPSKSIKYLGINIDRFLDWYDQVNSIGVKLNRANSLLLKIRNYFNMKTLRNIYFEILNPHLSYSCIVQTQNIKEINHSSEESTLNNEFRTMKLGDKFTLKKYSFSQ